MALVRVYERILTVAAEADGCYFAPGGVVSCRLLIDMSVVGFVIGRCGNVVERIKKDTGCKIRVLSQERSPSCALPNDEMIEVSMLDVFYVLLLLHTKCLIKCQSQYVQFLLFVNCIPTV